MRAWRGPTARDKLLLVTHRGWSVRLLALIWATLLVASPGLSALADANASTRFTGDPGHVEERTSSSCPVVHPPDCGLCRHLTTAATTTPALAVVVAQRATVSGVERDPARHPGAASTLHWGRAPPLG